MVIAISPELETALKERAHQLGITAEQLAASLLRQHLMPVIPRDEWEQELLGAAVDCGVSPPDSAFIGEELYD